MHATDMNATGMMQDRIYRNGSQTLEEDRQLLISRMRRSSTWCPCSVAFIGITPHTIVDLPLLSMYQACAVYKRIVPTCCWLLLIPEVVQV